MEKTTLRLSTELRGALSDFARRTGRSQAAVVRDALATYLSQCQRPVLRSVGIGENRDPNAIDTEEWLEANGWPL